VSPIFVPQTIKISSILKVQSIMSGILFWDTLCAYMPVMMLMVEVVSVDVVQVVKLQHLAEVI